LTQRDSRVEDGVARPRLLVLNQYYKPGVEATANLLADLCEALAADYEVTVVTGRLHGRTNLPDSEVLNGVRVLRTRSTNFDRTKLSHRGINYVTYLADSIVRSLSLESPSLLLCMTDPPIVGDLGVALARRFGAPLLVISEDVFPEIATELDRLTNPVVIGILRKLVAFYLRRADHIVAIGDRMRARLIEKGAPADRITVIPNWVDAGEIQPLEHANRWSVEHGLADKFVVMHSGNVGHAQNLDNLVRATTLLRDLDDLVVPIVGFGARHAEIRELSERLDADRVVFLPYQARELLPQSLASAHIHYVGLAKGLAGFVVPSRLYGILAAGRPVIVAADPDSETAHLVAEVGCGVTIPPDRPDLLVRAIRAAHDGELDLEGMGRLGREYVEREADRPVALARYRSLVASLMATAV
jgi:putative colanic acid biosynthesis glycosyltransferase WcaI